MSELIDAEEIESWMKKVPEWDFEEASITRTIEVDGFMDGIELVNDIAEVAEEENHHPDIDIRWGRIVLTLTTHDEGGLTEEDFALARRLDNLVD